MENRILKKCLALKGQLVNILFNKLIHKGNSKREEVGERIFAWLVIPFPSKAQKDVRRKLASNLHLFLCATVGSYEV